MHCPRVDTAKKTTNITQAQMGSPQKEVRLGFLGWGLGSSVWQRQQTVLSSGFQVPQFGQSGMVVVSPQKRFSLALHVHALASLALTFMDVLFMFWTPPARWQQDS